MALVEELEEAELKSIIGSCWDWVIWPTRAVNAWDWVLKSSRCPLLERPTREAGKSKPSELAWGPNPSCVEVERLPVRWHSEMKSLEALMLRGGEKVQGHPLWKEQPSGFPVAAVSLSGLGSELSRQAPPLATGREMLPGMQS